jgi:AraC-like DNA-binding protein
VAWEALDLPHGHHGRAWLSRRFNFWPRHRHDELELNLVMRGRTTYLVGDRRVALERHTLFALFPDQEHIVVERTPDCVMWLAVFAPALVRRHARGRLSFLASPDPAVDGRWRLAPAQARTLDAAFVGTASARTTAGANAALAALLLLSSEAMAEAPQGERSAAVHPAVERAARAIRENPALDGAAVARAVGLSRARLSRLFKAQIGVALSDYRARERLAGALALVRAGRRTLLDAALAAGYGSYAQFHRAVTRELGVRPRELAALAEEDLAFPP